MRSFLLLLSAIAFSLPVLAASPPDSVEVVAPDDSFEAGGAEADLVLAQADIAASAAPEIPGVVVAGPSAATVLVAVPSAPSPEPEPLPGDEDVVGRGKAAYDAARAAREAPTVAAISAAIVAGIMLLISLARRFGGLLLTSNQVRVFVIVAGALAGGIAQVSDGMAWWQILFIAFSPVVSVGVHQVFVRPVAKKKQRG